MVYTNVEGQNGLYTCMLAKPGGIETYACIHPSFNHSLCQNLPFSQINQSFGQINQSFSHWTNQLAIHLRFHQLSKHRLGQSLGQSIKRGALMKVSWLKAHFRHFLNWLQWQIQIGTFTWRSSVLISFSNHEHVFCQEGVGIFPHSSVWGWPSIFSLIFPFLVWRIAWHRRRHKKKSKDLVFMHITNWKISSITRKHQFN